MRWHARHVSSRMSRKAYHTRIPAHTSSRMSRKHTRLMYLYRRVEVHVFVGTVLIHRREEEPRNKDEFTHEAPDDQSARGSPNRRELPVEIEYEEAHDPCDWGTDQPGDPSLGAVVSHRNESTHTSRRRCVLLNRGRQWYRKHRSAGVSVHLSKPEI